MPTGRAAILQILGAPGAQPDLIRINADAEALLGDVLPLLEALEADGIPRIYLVVTPSEAAP